MTAYMTMTISTVIFSIVKSNALDGNVARMRETKNTYRILMGKAATWMTKELGG
jgi:hypothetical protein